MSIDPIAKRVTTHLGPHEADFLVVALGADYDFDATPGLADTTEFYTVAGAARLSKILPTFTKGHVRRLRGTVQMSASPQRSGIDDARLPHGPRCP